MPAIPYVGSLYDYSRGPGANISGLLLEQGRARAAGADRIGQIWANTVQNLGQIPQQVQEQKLRELQIQEQANERQARTAELEAQTKEREQHTRDLAEQSQREAILSEKLDSGQPVAATDFYRALGMEKGFNAYKAYSELQKPQPDLKTVAIGFNGLSDEEKVKRWPTVAAKMAQAHGADPSIIPGEFNQGWLDNLLESNGWAPKKEKPHLTKITVPGGPTGKMAKNVTDEELAAGVPEYKEPTQDSGGESDVPLTEATLNLAAKLYLKTGQLPPMGMGKVGAEKRSRILNRAAEMDPSADIAGNIASFGANKQSLAAVQKNYDAVSAFEKTAHANGAILEAAVKKIPDSGTRFLNKPYRFAASQLGSEDQAAFETIRQAVRNEYSRIISQPNLAGQLTDSARKEGEAILSGDYTAGQLIAAYHTLISEAANRKQSYKSQIDDISKRISGGSDTSNNETPKKVVTQAQLEAVAKRKGESVEETRRRAEAEGYTVQ